MRRAPDAIVATGRTDYPNQVNNVLGFPFIFRGALDVGATTINEAMKLAAMEAIAELARIEADDVVVAAYGGIEPVFGRDYIIPKPFDPRLILTIPPAVAKAAMESGVATRPITDFDAYRMELERFAYRSGQVMRPVFEAARKAQMRIAYAEGEDERVLRAVQTVLDERIGQPVLVGRRERDRGSGCASWACGSISGAPCGCSTRRRTATCSGRLSRPISVWWDAAASRRRRRQGGSRPRPRSPRRCCCAEGEADAAICGGTGDWWQQMRHVLPIIPRCPQATRIYALSCLILQAGVLFLCDTYMNVDPTAEQVAEMTLLAAEAVRAFGMAPKVALVSHSSFGASNAPRARKMRAALALIRAQAPDLEVDGEMHADAALNEVIRGRAVPDSRLSGSANLLVMPTLDAANISFNLLKAAADGLPVGPLLLGMSKPIHVAVPSVTARGLVNISAIAALQAAAGG